MRWLEVSARVDADTVDAATELLARYAYGSVVVEEVATGKPSDAAIVSPALRVKAYLPDDPSLEGKVRELDEAWWHLRQIRRDLSALGEAGHPVDLAAGPGGRARVGANAAAAGVEFQP